jgi:hypothetical protein
MIGFSTNAINVHVARVTGCFTLHFSTVALSPQLALMSMALNRRDSSAPASQAKNLALSTSLQFFEIFMVPRRATVMNPKPSQL